VSVAERIYYDDPALEFTTSITDIRLVSREGTDHLWQLAFDRTAFYPTGGGQPCDTGLLIATAPSGATLEVPVERVEEDDAGELWHFVRKPLNEGTAITGRIDAARRMDHAQQHSGQHLLSAIFLRELAAPTVSFHLGADSVTIDLAIERITDEDLQRIELAANHEVFANHSIETRWVARDEADAMLARGELRKLPDREGPMRIVTLHGIEHNPCGGTHVASTGAIGSILLRRVEKNKKNQRVEFVCGLRAVMAARRDLTVLRQTASLLSTGMPDLPARVEKLLQDNKSTAKELKALKRLHPDAPAAP
jgi:alanyl-tRNA synthetase